METSNGRAESSQSNETKIPQSRKSAGYGFTPTQKYRGLENPLDSGSALRDQNTVIEKICGIRVHSETKIPRSWKSAGFGFTPRPKYRGPAGFGFTPRPSWELEALYWKGGICTNCSVVWYHMKKDPDRGTSGYKYSKTDRLGCSLFLYPKPYFRAPSHRSIAFQSLDEGFSYLYHSFLPNVVDQRFTCA